MVVRMDIGGILPGISGPEVISHFAAGINQRQFHGERLRKIKLGEHASGVPGIPSGPQAVKHFVIIPDRGQVVLTRSGCGTWQNGADQKGQNDRLFHNSGSRRFSVFTKIAFFPNRAR